MVISARLASALGILAVVVLLLKDSWSWSGPVLLKLTASHGVHATDIPILLAAFAAIGLVMTVRAPAPVRTAQAAH